MTNLEQNQENAKLWRERKEWADKEAKVNELKAKGQWHDPELLERDKRDGKVFRVVHSPYVG